MTERQWEPADDDIIASPRQTIHCRDLDDEARGGLVRGMLRSAGLSTMGVAPLVGVSRSTICRWCQSASVPQLQKLAGALGVVVVLVGE
jgi:hypothetical protein